MAPTTRQQALTAVRPVVRRIFLCWTFELIVGFIHIGLALPTYYQINYDVRYLVIFITTGGLTIFFNIHFIWKLKNHRDQQSLHDMSWISYFLPALTASMAGVSALLTIFLMANSNTQLSVILFISQSASFAINVALNFAGLYGLAKIYTKLNPQKNNTQRAIAPATADEDIQLLTQNPHLNQIIEYGTQQGNATRPDVPRSRNTLPRITHSTVDATAPELPSEEEHYGTNYAIERHDPQSSDISREPLQKPVLPNITQQAHALNAPSDNVNKNEDGVGLPSYNEIFSSQEKQ
ncbi:uncharacterized protein TRIADDRAFT_58227 [Trichoplax adhaerens]|uniref:Uncharacterized protein n=1 Tax=Trichoplax adhaerens TaxID=10228 RepID=B3S177_TRIAD|nr:predicted protein [Trichoplax adhaerens]EDV23194.1 predicted protein [Trichoplax adhaerens]|eukprot:XP_002114104.1 predicted protein [Trichoplax adhaerens]